MDTQWESHRSVNSMHFNMLVGRCYILNKNHNWTFLLHEFFFFPFFFARIFFLGIFPCMNFFLAFSPPPPPPITFLMVHPLERFHLRVQQQNYSGQSQHAQTAQLTNQNSKQIHVTGAKRGKTCDHVVIGFSFVSHWLRK